MNIPARVHRAIAASILAAALSLAPSPLSPPVPPSPRAAHAAEPPTVLSGQAGGPVYAVAVAGRFAYVGEGLGLTVLDVADPRRPRVVGRSAPWADFVQDVAVEGNHAYVAAGAAGLRVVDVADPSRPREVGRWDTEGTAWSVALAGGFAYVADGSEGLQVVDVWHPGAPRGVGSLRWDRGEAQGVAVDGALALLAASDGGVRVVGIADPSRPRELAVIPPVDGEARDVALAGDIAYVAVGDVGVRGYDVSDPASPRAVMEQSLPGRDPRGIAVACGRLYVAGGPNTGLWAARLDRSGRVDPATATGLPMPGEAAAVAVSGAYAYLANGTGGLQIAKVAPWAPDPAVAGTALEDPFLFDVAVAGGYAYAAHSDGTIRVWDVRDAAAPVPVGRVGIDAPVRMVDNQPRTARFLLEAEGGALVAAVQTGDQIYALRVFDITDPARPRLVPSAETNRDRSLIALAVSGGLAYVKVDDNHTSVDVFDTRGLRTVRHMGRQVFAQTGRTIAVVGSCVYLGGFGSLAAFDAAPAPGTDAFRGSSSTIGIDLDRVVVVGERMYWTGVDRLNQRAMIMVFDAPSCGQPRLVGEAPVGLDFSAPVFAEALPPHVYLVGRTPMGYRRSAVKVVDTQSPFGLQVVDLPELSLLGLVSGTAMFGDTLVVASNNAFSFAHGYSDSSEGGTNLRAIRVPPEHAPRVVASYDPPRDSRVVHPIGDRLVVADGAHGLTVLDAARPDEPRLIERHPAPDFVVAMSGDRDRIALATSSSLHLLDATGRDANMIGSLYLGQDTVDVAFDGRYAAYAQAGGHWGIVDTLDPRALRLVAGRPPTYASDPDAPLPRASRIILAGDRLYLAGRPQLVAFDVSRRDQPVRLGISPVAAMASDVAVAGQHALVADALGLAVMDVSDPTNIVLAGRLAFGASTEHVAVAGGVAYVALDNGELHAVDVSDPRAPRDMGSRLLPARAMDLSVVGCRVLVAGGLAGVMVLPAVAPDCVPPLEPLPTPAVSRPRPPEPARLPHAVYLPRVGREAGCVW